jgi:hypothetical protein
VEAHELKYEDEQKRTEKTLGQLAGKLKTLSAKAEDDELVILEAIRIYSRVLGCQTGPLLKLLESHPRGLQIAADEISYGECQPLWEALVKAYGLRDILSLLGVMRLDLKPEINLVLLERACRHMIADPGVNEETKSVFAYQYLNQLYKADLNDLLISEYEKLPERIRKDVLTVTQSRRRVEVDNVQLEFIIGLSGMPFGIAAAYHEAGDDKTALYLLKTIRETNRLPKKSDFADDEQRRNLFQLANLLEYSIEPDKKDTFKRFIGDRVSGWYQATINAEPVWVRLGVKVALNDEYPAIAHEIANGRSGIYKPYLD